MVTLVVLQNAKWRVGRRMGQVKESSECAKGLSTFRRVQSKQQERADLGEYRVANRIGQN